ncbi:cytochrome P450 [Lactarius psammicola]|nr:cytochrome P450 [Lactarius psammicola]
MYNSFTFPDLLLLVSVTGVLSLLVLKHLRATRSRSRLPPGPRGYPLIGNIFDMPTCREWETFTEWGQKYGPITYFHMAGEHFVILNSLETTMGMLDAKSAIYSDRPVFPMLGETMGWDRGLVLAHYGERFRAFRRLVHRFMGTRTIVSRHHDTITHHTHRFLLRLLDAPEKFIEHLRGTAGSVVLDLVYGYQVKERDDEIVHIAEVATLEFSRAATPGAFLVDSLPFLRHVPEWFPGAGWKKLGREWRADTYKVVDTPFEYTQQRRAAGISETSFVDAYSGDGMSEEDADILKWGAASIYFGGADTMVSSTSSFFLAMTLYPDVMKKAQAELDAVVGPHRLPTFADWENLPYLDAVSKEVLRWAPVTPFGGHHRLMEDDIQDGYLIPAGTAIIVNMWVPSRRGLLHNEKIYSHPMTFDPERFLATEKRAAELDPHKILFGYGRRTCPGNIFFPYDVVDTCSWMHFADATMFLYMATILAAFDISKPVDDCGRVIEVKADFTSGLVSLEPFVVIPECYSHDTPKRITFKIQVTKAED